MRKRLLLGFLSAVLCVMHAAAAKSSATIVSDPAPIYAEKPFTITITLSGGGNWDSDVYLWTWAVCDNVGKNPIDKWENGCVDAMKMQKTDNSTFMFSVSDLKSFYGLSDDQFAGITKCGFIARTKSGDQTDDLFVNVEHFVQLYSGGDGSEADPYQLSNEADLNNLASTPDDWGKCFKVTADIALTADFKGIGSMDAPFTGRFDGGHFTISGAKIAGSGGIGSATGFFSALGQGASVSDLGLKNVTVTGATYCGGLAGYVASGASVARCYTSGTVSGKSICIGGLAGENRGSIADCYSTANVTSDGDYAAGGFAGKNTGSIERCYASGDVKAHNYVGAVVGANYGTVLHCVAMNHNVTSAGGSKYAGRFGGNNNGENKVQAAVARAAADGDTNLSWSGMNHSQGKWDDYAHHAVDADQALGEKATYADRLGWDFGTTWKWVGKDKADAQSTLAEQRYPVLAGIEGQEAPAGNEFYEMTAIEVLEADTAGGIEVFPTAVENTFTVSAPAAIAALQVTAVNGAGVLTLGGDGSQQMTVDFSGAAPGVYFLGVTLADGSHSAVKLLKK